MKWSRELTLAALAGVLACAGALAQTAAKAGNDTAVSSSSTTAQSGFGVLAGRWVRPDGGYVISIKTAEADGKLDASYANPNPLPFYTAQATRDGNVLKLSFELRAGGYNGSTYTLSYDAASDQLRGVYYQAVAKQSFQVNFVRMK